MYSETRSPVLGANLVLLIHLFFFLADLLPWVIQAVIGVQYWFIFGGWSIYLTLWGQLTQTIYFGLALVVDFGIRSRKPWAPALVHHRDRFFTFEFPLANLISIVFWGLIFPVVGKALMKDSGEFILCLFQHGLTGIAVYVEMFIQNHRYGKSWHELCILYLYSFAYLAWTMVCYSINKHWPYPFQQGLSAGGEVVLNFFMLCFASSLYLWGRFLTRWFWQSHVDSLGRKVPEEMPFLAADDEQPDSIPSPDTFLSPMSV